MKRIQLASASLAATALVGLAGYGLYPDEFGRGLDGATRAARRAGSRAADDAGAVALAAGTFLLTVGYHKARGKSLRESLEVAATRVTAAPAAPSVDEAEAAVLRRAKARATRTQLVADQIVLENRHRALPEAIRKAERDACYTESALADAARALAVKEEVHADAVARLAALRDEKAASEAEAAAIAAELKKLADAV